MGSLLVSIRLIALAALLVAPHGLLAQDSTCRPIRTALVLSGGGVKGVAHIGVLEAFDRIGFRPDLIVGTSIGAIVGGLYASGYSARQIDSLTRALPLADIVRPFRVTAPDAWDDRLPLVFMVRGRKGFELQTGVVDESRPNARLNAALLRGNLIARGDFDRLPIPFRAVATDLRNRATVVIRDGDLARAVRASSAVPLVFPPVVIDSAVLVDGGLSANIPIAEARQAGADRVIVVDVTARLSADLDPESPFGLAEQLIGFLFNQAEASLGPNDVYVRPAVQDYRTLDFSPETIAEILEHGRRAADTTLQRAQCLGRSEPSPAMPVPRILSGWSVSSGVASDSVFLGRMLPLTAPRRLEVERLRSGLLDIAEIESFRGAWLNPSGRGDSVQLRLEPMPVPRTIGGGGLAYDHEWGGKIWLGLFDRRLAGTTFEGSALASLGKYEQEFFGSVVWHTRGGWSAVAPHLTLRVRSDDIRQFTEGGIELPHLVTNHARVSAGVDVRFAPGWRAAVGGDVVTWGTETTRGKTALGGSARLTRTGQTGVSLTTDALVMDAFQRLRATVSLPVVRRGWRLMPAARVGWGSAQLPEQMTFPLGGSDGFPGIHHGERRGTRELMGALNLGVAVVRPLEVRVQAAAGRAWLPGLDATDWLYGARVGLGA
ncbi:MAG: patatin-like phospholipase family protein, partial [Gemmatimonadales bacterium]